MLEKYGHGGDLKTAEELYGRAGQPFLDYSSNMNPWGPPAAVADVLSQYIAQINQYPDPAVRELRSRIAEIYRIPENSILIGNGAAELIDLVVRVLKPQVTGIARPSFSEYEEAVEKICGAIHDIPLKAEHDFELQAEDAMHAAQQCSLLFLGHPNNPTGKLLPNSLVSNLIEQQIPLVLDEAFMDFIPEEEELSFIREAPHRKNLFIVRSMTKFYSIPGIRLGFIVGHPEQIAKLNKLQVPWSVNSLAQAIGTAVLDDSEFRNRTLNWLSKERDWLTAQLQSLHLKVIPSKTNYLLFAFAKPIVKAVQKRMGQLGVLVRDGSRFPGLDESYCRIAIRKREDNERFLSCLQEVLLNIPVKAPTLMVQGTASDVGKSILTAALCRILTQDGLQVVPFKSQNMSLNSYVTPDGKEIGRAQGLQADACRIAATTDMNPILLKPSKDMVAQVVVHGKPFGDWSAKAYREDYLPKAEAIVKEALDRLRNNNDCVVIEGAGSPAEINLKDRDIVNMRLAGWADAPVVLVADIDRGGVFATIVGTLELLLPEERDRVKGFIINKFRGDVSLLQPGLDWLEEKTGKPVLGVIPYLHQLGLEDEDSASLDRKLQSSITQQANEDQLDVAVIRLPRISNFTDFDPLMEEQDVNLRYVSNPSEWGNPDIVLLPGSKNTAEDLLFLRESGLEPLILGHIHKEGWLTGICAGYQMLGTKLLDPHRVESDNTVLNGLRVFPSETTFAKDKQTVRTSAVTALYNPDHSSVSVEGYEIHMGRTTFTEAVKQPFTLDSDGKPEGAVSTNSRVWGTYLHGILHNDDFRRNWLNEVRLSKGLSPLPAELRFKERREAAFDRLAEHVRTHLDMKKIYEMIKLPPRR